MKRAMCCLTASRRNCRQFFGKYAGVPGRWRTGGKNGESWVTSGDIGYLDEKGFLHIVDRKKRSLKIAAVNVFPLRWKIASKVELCGRGVCRALHRQRQTVSESVCNAEHPHAVGRGEKSVEDICSANPTCYSVPRFVEVLDKMPRTDFGKIDYVSLEKDETVLQAARLFFCCRRVKTI